MPYYTYNRDSFFEAARKVEPGVKGQGVHHEDHYNEIIAS
jgi:hypothetical protein